MTGHTTYDDLADIYEVWIANMTAVTALSRHFYVGQYLSADGPVAELGVGNGRILVEAARRGKEVIGVDYSARMLDLCRRRADEAGVAERVQLIQADFRDFELTKPAALIAVPYDTLGHLVTLDAIRACLRQVHSQLERGGRFLFDMKVPNGVPEYDRRPYLYATFTNPSTDGEVMLWVTIVHDQVRQCRTTYLWTEEIERDGSVGPRKVRRVENACLFGTQLRRLLTETGFEVDAISDLHQGPVTEKSEYQLVLAHRT